jgi:hypothetical protein
MALNAVCERGMLSRKLFRSPDYCSFASAIQAANVLANNAAGTVTTTCDHCGQAVNDMELGGFSNVDRNIRKLYSRDEFGYARGNALGIIPIAIHAGNKFLSRVKVSV